MPKPKKQNNSRSIDQAVNKAEKSLGSRFMLVSKTEIKAWKAFVLIIFAAGFLAAMVWSAYNSWYIGSGAEGSKKKVITATDSCKEHKKGEVFQSVLALDTGGDGMTAVYVVANYNPNDVEVSGIDTSASDFKYEVKKSIDSQNGKIIIALGQKYPGINSSNARIATVSLKALNDFKNESLKLKFDSPAAINDSAAIRGDSFGTNTLDKVKNDFAANSCSSKGDGGDGDNQSLPSPPADAVVLVIGNKPVQDSPNATITTKKKNIVFKGNLSVLAGGIAQIYSKGKLIKNIPISTTGYWRYKGKIKSGRTNFFQIIFLGPNGEKTFISDQYKIKKK